MFKRACGYDLLGVPMSEYVGDPALCVDTINFYPPHSLHFLLWTSMRLALCCASSHLSSSLIPRRLEVSHYAIQYIHSLLDVWLNFSRDLVYMRSLHYPCYKEHQ